MNTSTTVGIEVRADGTREAARDLAAVDASLKKIGRSLGGAAQAASTAPYMASTGTRPTDTSTAQISSTRMVTTPASTPPLSTSHMALSHWLPISFGRRSFFFIKHTLPTVW